MADATQVGLLLQLILGLYDDLDRHEPGRVAEVRERLWQTAAQSDDPGTKLEMAQAAKILESFTGKSQAND